MKTRKKGYFAIFKEMTAIMKYSLANVIIFEVLYKIFTSFFIKPVIGYISSFFLWISGNSLITNSQIRGFFLSFNGVLMGIIIVSISTIVIFFEYSVILILLKSGYEKKSMDLGFAIKSGVYTLKSLLHPSTVFLSFYVMIFIPLLQTGIRSSLIEEFIIPTFISDEVLKHDFGIAIILSLVVIGITVFAMLFFALPIMVFEQKNFWQSSKKSMTLMKSKKIKMLIVTFLSTVLLILTMSGLLLLLALNSNIIYISVIIILFILTEIYFSPMLLSAMLVSYAPKDIPAVPESVMIKIDKFIAKLREFFCYIAEYIKLLWHRFAPKKLKNRPAVLLILPLAIFTFTFFARLNNSFNIIPQIIGHRGSDLGVENSLEAILGAGESSANYAEIDVLLSKDNVPMVIHDNNLQRLSKTAGFVSSMTADELSLLTIYSGNEVGKISTLDEVCSASKGKINLLIEFKTHGYEEASIVKKSVEIVEANGLLEETLFQTAEIPLLEQANLFYPYINMGYVIISRVGRISANAIGRIPADFLAFEASLVNENLIMQCKKAGKPIYVWTVNSQEELKSFLLLGVDGIITDHPGLLYEISLSENEDTPHGDSQSETSDSDSNNEDPKD